MSPTLATMAVLRGLSGFFALAVGGCSFAGTGLTAGTGESAEDSTGGSTAGEAGASTTTDPTQPPATEEGSVSLSSMPPTSDPDPSTTTGPGLETTGTGDVPESSTGSTTVETTAETGETTAGTSGEATTETGSEGSSTGCTQQTWYLDDDGDGFGQTNSTIEACKQPDGYAGEPDDCDDDVKQINPGAPEKCDRFDNDCDGFVNEWSAMNKECGGCKLTANDELNPTKTYFFCQSPLTWMAASTSCTSKDAALVADEQTVEHNYLLAQLNVIDADSGPWWTGGHEAGGLDLTFSWINGVAIANGDSRWAVNPVLIDGTHCVRLLSPGVNNGGKWVEDDCGDPLPYICEQDN